ncbi:6-hydroxy-D-nicotine oxidase [Ruegeria sp. THAF57]|uniref:FAD-binding oxidoreductase n=1 Tax=Ruegeria sp. THAF57 TaxID=2744555 RepID=UPI0015DF8AF5|nr:FAD-binding oxidoreductase [Ruegeria sp. THAF57]CAD0185964.1 6-hydroxy-D-nicotine oxidase [Ruegeria sp. THAF57]
MFDLKSLDGDMVTVDQDALDALSASLRGGVYLRGSPEYDEARTTWNSMVERYPGFVIRALGASDVQKAVNFVRNAGLVMSVRSGGHQIAGHAVADETVMLDLSHMRSVHVDPIAKSARVAPGAVLGDVDRETQAHGLVVPTGINSTTGIAGLTLGGGFGWSTRKFGMTIDNLVSAEVVTAEGEIVTASASSHPELFWAIRGGGGNFGVVTSFEFQLHDLGPEVLSGLIVHPIENAPALLAEYAKIADTSPDELTVWSVMRKAPPLPFLPEEWHGREILIFAACYAGAMEDGEKAVARLRALGDPIVDVISPHSFVDWQAAFDALLTPGARNYWKSHDFETLSSDAITGLLDGIATLPDPACEVFIAHVGGAMARVGADSTAYPQRSAHFIMNVHTRWEDPAKDAECIDWARTLYDRMQPHATGSAYVNFMPEDEADHMAGAYGANGSKLSKIKGKYDPGNLFRVNHNILPT